jgi:hypothetical protein
MSDVRCQNSAAHAVFLRARQRPVQPLISDLGPLIWKGCVDGGQGRLLQMSRQLPDAGRLRVLTSDL